MRDLLEEGLRAHREPWSAEQGPQPILLIGYEAGSFVAADADGQVINIAINSVKLDMRFDPKHDRWLDVDHDEVEKPVEQLRDYLALDTTADSGLDVAGT